MQKSFNRSRIAFSTNGAGKTKYPPEENEVEPLPHTLYKIN
jgi:hypothetical protein